MNPMPILRLLAALTLGATLAAAQGAPAPKTLPTSTSEPTPPRPDGLKSRLFLLQYRAPDFRLVDLLRPLGSGNYWAGIQATDKDGLKAITVRDFPENIAAIEDAIKRLDVAEPARKSVEFHIHVLFASRQDGQGGGVPDELKDVLASLKDTLSYHSYTLVASFVQRAADGLDFIPGEGEAEMLQKTSKGDTQIMPIDIGWNLSRLNLAGEQGGAVRIGIQRFELNVWERVGAGHGAKLAQIGTNLAMKNGEKIVVGTSMIRDKAMIVVLTAKIVD
ncbi:MAG TPA: hypothetical protein VNV60_05865 [Holophagaceae bacterium]|jgi:hypothetical protein|nr:hypothetical protein [Holophagaceae bacterium]